MRLTFSATAPLSDLRPVEPAERRPRYAEIARELDADYIVRPAVEPSSGNPCTSSRWPLGALLGLDGSPERALWFVVHGVGIDWIRSTIGLDPLPDGKPLTGHEIVEQVQEATDLQAPSLETLRYCAASMHAIGVDGPPALEPVAAADALDELLGQVDAWTSRLIGADGQLVVAYESHDLIRLAAIELLLRSEHLTPPLRPCGHCGMLFAPAERADEEYCRRPAVGERTDRTCRVVGPQRRYADTIDELTATYRREYKRLDKRQRRGAFQREDLDAWREQAREVLEAARNEEWDVERLVAALESIDPEGDRS